MKYYRRQRFKTFNHRTAVCFGVFLAQEDNGKPWHGFAPNCVYTAEAAVVLTLVLVFEHTKKIPFREFDWEGQLSVVLACWIHGALQNVLRVHKAVQCEGHNFRNTEF